MVRLVSELRYFILGIVSFIVSKIFKTKDIILFESCSDFCDNSKALFDYMIKQKLNKKYKMIWYVRENSTIEKYKNRYQNVEFKKLVYTIKIFSKDFWSMLYYFSVARYSFYTHAFIGGPGNKNQTIVFLTHGSIGLKNSKGFFGKPTHNNYIVSTSEFASFYSALCYDGGIDRFRMLGMPRNDQLFIKSKNIKKILPKDQYSKIILWMPTFKHINNNKRNDFNSKSKNDISILSEQNINKINKKLRDENILLIIKFHPAQNMDFVKRVRRSNIINITNDQLLENEIDLYTFIGSSDALITDYSSVYFDYLLLNRPIAFELGDFNQYKNGIGFIFEEPLKYMPGEKIYNVDDFICFIENMGNDIDLFKKERKTLLNHVHKHKDNNSSKRIVDYLNIK